jgi:hypothetical protein
MFDYFQPVPPLVCPVCGITIKVWQGKDGPNALLVWRQGAGVPIEQRVDEDCRLPVEHLGAFTLPQSFEFYSFECGKHHLVAVGRTEGGIWRTAEVVRVSKSSDI